MVYKFLDKKSPLLARSETLATQDKSASGGGIKNKNMSKQELAKELYKPTIKKFEKRKVNSCFIDDIQDANLVNKL